MAGPPLGVHVGVSFSWANAFWVDLKGDKEEPLFFVGRGPPTKTRPSKYQPKVGPPR